MLYEIFDSIKESFGPTNFGEVNDKEHQMNGG